jgi:hypothetical protein
LHRFAEAVLQPDLIDRVFPPDSAGFAPGSRGAVYLRTVPLPGTGTLAFHVGAGMAYGGYWLFIPEKRFAAVMTGAVNRWPGPVKDIVNMVLDAYGFGSTAYDDSFPKSQWTEYEGVYAREDGTLPIEVFFDPTTLTLRKREPGTTDPGQAFTPASAYDGLGDTWDEQIRRDVFTLEGVAPMNRLRFYRDATGRPTRIVANQYPQFETRYRQP